jgi:hypothetical protein
MGRTIVIMLLLVTMMQGQEVDPSKRPVTPQGRKVRLFRDLVGKRKPEIYGSIDFQYDKLRRGTSEFAQVAVESSNSAFAIARLSGRESRVEPTKLELKASQGIQILSVINPESTQEKFAFDSRSFKVLRGSSVDPIRFRFKLRASPDLVPGDYIVKATVSYRIISEAGISEAQQLRVEVPITVVERKSKVETGDRGIAGIRGISPAEWIEDIRLAPLMIPVAIFMAIIGWDGC